MKVIFLDIDGVLNGGNLPFFSKELPDIHPHLAAKLEQIVQATSAKIIISSSWRHRLSIVEWNELLTRRGVTGEVVGTTPKYWEQRFDSAGAKQYESAREDEIQEWLAANPVENFLVLDDIPMVELKANAVETEFRTGMTDLDVVTAIEILNQKIVMDDQKKKYIMDSFRLINSLAAESTNDHRGLARHTRIVIDALNQLFVLNGLEGNENLFIKCDKCEKLLRYSWEVKLHVCGETK